LIVLQKVLFGGVQPQAGLEFEQILALARVGNRVIPAADAATAPNAATPIFVRKWRRPIRRATPSPERVSNESIA